MTPAADHAALPGTAPPGTALPGAVLPGAALRAYAATAAVSAVVVLACWRVGQTWIVYPSIALTAIGGALVGVRARRRPQARVAWAMMAAGLLGYVGGAQLGLMANQYGWLPVEASYVCSVIGILSQAGAVVLLLRRDAPTFRVTAALDGLAVTLGVIAAGVLCFEPLLRRTEAGAGTVVALMLYPAGDVLVLCVAIGALATLGWPWRGVWGRLAAGFAVLLVFDSLYTFGALDGTYTGGLLVDMFWPFGTVLVVSAAWRTDAGDSTPSTGAGLWLLPFGITVGSLGILVADATGAALPTTASVIASAVIVAAFLRMALTFSEVAELAETRHQATHDDLTDLPNRRALYLRLESVLHQQRRLALLIMDLNRFKDVNDALGHGVGDDLLTEVARRLTDELADVTAAGGVIARLGGDEFAVVLPGAGRADGEALAGRIGEILRDPFPLDDVTLHVEASIGVALAPEQADERTALMRCADVAMYEAKRARSPFAVYSLGDQDVHRSRLETLGQLRLGLTRGEIICWFQPKADLRSGRIVGAEALVRWQHPSRGVLTPDAFLPLVEENGLMRRLTEIVLEHAFSACRTWREAGHDLTVAVNLSAANLLDADLATHVADSLHRFVLPGRSLRLEITEDVLLADPRRAAETIQDLRDLGIAVSMDDYGTGYSSLSHLRQLMIDELKLDRSFVTDLSARPRDLAIVSSTVDLAHALDLIVVAEGVESDDDWQTLTRMGCDQAQGYLLSKPLPPADFLAFVAQSQFWRLSNR